MSDERTLGEKSGSARAISSPSECFLFEKWSFTAWEAASAARVRARLIAFV